MLIICYLFVCMCGIDMYIYMYMFIYIYIYIYIYVVYIYIIYIYVFVFIPLNIVLFNPWTMFPLYSPEDKKQINSGFLEFSEGVGWENFPEIGRS